MGKKAKHETIPKGLKRLVSRLEKMKAVDKVVLGRIENCRHHFSVGSAKVLGETDAGLRLKAYFGSGVMHIFVVCGDKEAVRDRISPAMRLKKQKKKRYTVVKQHWVESERGFGMRSDGYSLHLSEEDRKKYVEQRTEIEHKLQRDMGFPEGRIPDTYSRAYGSALLEDVDEETYRRVENSECGVMMSD